MTVSSIHLCLKNCLVICTVTLSYVVHQAYSKFWHTQHSVFLFVFFFFQVSAGIFNHIQHYWGIFMHIETLLRYIVAYSGILNTLCNPCILITVPSQPCHILSPSMFRGKGLFKTPWNVGQTYAIGHYSALFRHIQNLMQHLHMEKTGILGMLEYAEPFCICIHMHIQNPVILTKI